MTTISLRLPDRLAERLEKESQSRQTTKSAIVRESLEQTLAETASKNLSCYDLTKDLVGSIKGLPKDLGIDPKYMEGYGEPVRKKRHH